MPLDSADFVVRGGVFPTAEVVMTAVLDSIEVGDGAVLSVHVGRVGTGETKEQAVARICELGDVRNRQIRLSSVGKLVGAGFVLELDTSDGQPECHHNVVFSDHPDIEQARSFIECFDEPIIKPTKDE